MLNLNEALNKSNTNTTNMLTILQSFENRLRKLENTVEPVYNETEMLRRRQESILQLASTKKKTTSLRLMSKRMINLNSVKNVVGVPDIKNFN